MLFESFYKLPIRIKLVLIVMLTSGVIIVAGSILIVSYKAKSDRGHMIDEASFVARMVGESNKENIKYENNEPALELLESLNLKKHINHICIYDTYSELFISFSSKASEESMECEESFIAHDLPSGGNIISIYKEIYVQGALLGTVVVFSMLPSTVDFLIEYSGYIALFITLSGVISSILYFLVQYFIVQRIVSMSSKAHKIARTHQYKTSFEVNFGDEIGALSRSLNFLLGEVNSKAELLNEQNLTLERKVKGRTKELAKQNKELEKQKQKAEEADAAKTEFIRNMSHEFRTPLHAIESFSNYIIKECDTVEPEKIKEYAKNILTSSKDRMYPLVSNIMDMAKMENQGETYYMQKYDLYEVISKELGALEALARDNKLELVFDKPNFTPELNFDNRKISQVLRNLLGNAIKFSPKGKGNKIIVKIEEAMLDKRSAVAVSVQDEGFGVPKTELEKVFDKFQQSSRSNTGAGGTGLGLAISKAIVQAHEGKIFAANAKGDEYAIFTFVIPKDVEVGSRTVKIGG